MTATTFADAGRDDRQSPRYSSHIYHQASKYSRLKLLHAEQQILEHTAAATGAYDPSYPKHFAARPYLDLPPPDPRFARRRLLDVLRSRRTRRRMRSGRSISLARWGHLLAAACGITARSSGAEEVPTNGLRAWPSAGAIYPLEVYLSVLQSDTLKRCWYHYCAARHQLAELHQCSEFNVLNSLLVNSAELLATASVMLVITGRFDRTQRKYGERGYRFVLMETGHLAQNILLVCEDLSLAAVPLGGFLDDGLAEEMKLDDQRESPLLVILIGSRAD